MTRNEFEKYISDTYGVNADFPWHSSPTNAVYRHVVGKKWFALVMDLKRSQIGGVADETIAVVNLKCPTMLVSSFCRDKGIYPAYHMSKANWISVVIEEADEEQLKALLDMSFNLTMTKPPRAK